MARSRADHLEAKRVYAANRRAQDPEAARIRKNEFYARNREDQKAKMREYAKRRFFWNRTMHLRADDRATPTQLSRLWKSQRGICALTGRRLDRTAQLDHILPRARGGGDNIENLRWVCAWVNMAKRNLTDAEFFSICSDVASWVTA